FPDTNPLGKRIRIGQERYRVIGVMDKRLSEARYLGGEEYTIADIAAWPWTRTPDRQGVNRDDYPNYKRWFEEIAERPAVQRGVEVLADLRSEGFDAKAKEILFGATQYARR
ncbi:MAG TPA: glutathione S-transferase family protein, partial [Kiloniellaceae bacterium]|nr:glutathione S-transferase family protein [Kiloniellaceae bacterium]